MNAKEKPILVVCEYLDVFPNELPRLPLEREVEFAIDVVLDTTIISKISYWMGPTELVKVKK